MDPSCRYAHPDDVPSKTARKPTRLSRLFDAVGEDHIELQNLAENVRGYRLMGGDSAVLTFTTEKDRALDAALDGGEKWAGIVVWIRREHIPQGWE